MNYWLIKSEPDVFSIQDLAKAKHTTTHWEGVRNYQARNFLRAMQPGDRALFYHSNADPSAVAGIVEIVRAAYPDPAAWDRKSDYHDPKASPENPVWSMVDVKLVEAFAREVPLDELRGVLDINMPGQAPADKDDLRTETEEVAVRALTCPQLHRSLAHSHAVYCLSRVTHVQDLEQRRGRSMRPKTLYWQVSIHACRLSCRGLPSTHVAAGSQALASSF